MTDYNDGSWHGWNGGGCPVHPKSVIDYVWHDVNLGHCIGGSVGLTANREACSGVAWGQVIRFRVTKPYREPREIWVNEYSNGDMRGFGDADLADVYARVASIPVTRRAVRYVEAPE
jgi:hypothetical protein